MKVLLHYVHLVVCAIFLFIYGCSKKATPTPSSGTYSTVLSRSLPGIDTATLWLTDGHNIGGYAKINSTTGKMIFHGYSPYPTIDSFILHVTSATPDTANLFSGGKKSTLLFNLHRGINDTAISYQNPMGMMGIGTSQPYYYMQIDGGSLPLFSIGRGLYTDTL